MTFLSELISYMFACRIVRSLCTRKTRNSLFFISLSFLDLFQGTENNVPFSSFRRLQGYPYTWVANNVRFA